MIERLAGRHGRQSTRYPFKYAINENGFGEFREYDQIGFEDGRTVTNVGKSRILQLQPPSEPATSQEETSAGPLCRVIPIEFVPPRSCDTLPPFEGDSTNDMRIERIFDQNTGKEIGSRSQQPGGGKFGLFSIPGEYFQTNTWTYWSQNQQPLTAFRYSRDPVFFVPEGDPKGPET